MAKAYTAKDITVLEGLEPVRQRPTCRRCGAPPPGLEARGLFVQEG